MLFEWKLSSEDVLWDDVLQEDDPYLVTFATCQDYNEAVIHFPSYLPTMEDRCFASNAKIPERGKFPRLNRTYISLGDRNTSDGH